MVNLEVEDIPEDWRKVVEIDDGCWPIFTDWLEEQGDLQLANGFKALLRREKKNRFPYPCYVVSNDPIGWNSSHDCSWWEDTSVFGNYTGVLPIQWLAGLSNHINQDESCIKRYKTVYEALHDAARAYPGDL